jgi:hypothetical protein
MLIDSHAHVDSPRYVTCRALASVVQRRNSRTWKATVALFTSSFFAAFSQNVPQARNLELRLESSGLKGGVPESFTFVFANVGSHDIHVPQVGPCLSKYGWLRLQLDYKCVVDDLQGYGGGCGGGGGDGPGILYFAKSWKTLKPGESLQIKKSRRDMFQIEDCPGHYDFWAEFTPPDLSAAEIKTLTEAGVDFPREHLTSNRLTFVKK